MNHSTEFPSNRPIRILVCDDHDMIRQAIISLLSQYPIFSIVADVADGQEALHIMEREPVDVLILDLEMPVLNGTDTAELVLQRFTDVKILILSAHNDEYLIANLLMKGIHGFVFKKNDKNDLINAINAVASGKKYFAEDIMDLLIDNFKNPKRIVAYQQGSASPNVGSSDSSTVSESIRESFTLREREVMKLLSEGKNSQEISDALQISIHTVEAHKRNMFKKANVHSGVALIRFALDHKLV